MCIEFLYVYFPVLLCLSVSVKWLAVKTTSEMTCCVSGGALNSTHSLTRGPSPVWESKPAKQKQKVEFCYIIQFTDCY